MVEAILKENFITSIRVDEFEIVSDVKKDKGGEGRGPDPHDLVESSLAACTLMTVKMYAARKEWKLTEAKVKVSIEKEDRESAEFKREVSFSGDLSEEQQEKLLEIANKCPIHRLLEGKIKISTSLK